MKNMIVGLTGQTGAGKSTVSEYLRMKGITVIDADKVAREVVEKGTDCVADIALEFGCEYLNGDGTLNRRKLADTVFTDKTKLRRLNHTMFPYILETINGRIAELRAKEEGIIVLDAPTLFESGIYKNCDHVVSVIAPEAMRFERICRRDSLTEDEARHRIRAQHDDEYYTSRSWKTIINEGDLPSLRKQASEIIEQLKQVYSEN